MCGALPLHFPHGAKVFAQMDEFVIPDTILASSASGITMDVIQSSCKHPELCDRPSL
jgi:3-hydroxyacyl-CoA dehydrogenase